MAVLLAATVCGCGQSGTENKARGAYHQALATCGTDGEAHSAALLELLELQRAHPKNTTVADAFLQAWKYEAKHGC